MNCRTREGGYDGTSGVVVFVYFKEGVQRKFTRVAIVVAQVCRFDTFINGDALSKKASNLRVYDSNLCQLYLYLLPKIHKHNNPGVPLYPPAPVPQFIFLNFRTAFSK